MTDKLNINLDPHMTTEKDEIPESAQALVKEADARYAKASELFRIEPKNWTAIDYSLAESMLGEVHSRLKV
ncbi:MAG TPA: hypothetical protein VFB99_16325, partial [Vicinamibacterales bacterium]|nr:hypothetical protein [Vicinamibacterales bacterium]